MRLQKLLEQLKEKDIPIILLNGKPLRVIEDADNEEGWVKVPDLSNVVGINLDKNATEDDEPTAPEHYTLTSSTLVGQVEFRVFNIYTKKLSFWKGDRQI